MVALVVAMVLVAISGLKLKNMEYPSVRDVLFWLAVFVLSTGSAFVLTVANG